MSESVSASHRDHAPTLDEQAGHCFACGPANPQGMHLEFRIDAEGHTATADIKLGRIYEGPPGYIHGGIIATLMDEAMSKLNKPLGVLAMTRNMEIDYLRPSPLHVPLILLGRHVRRDGRKLFHEAELKLRDGTVLAQGKGVFIALSQELVARVQRSAG